MKHQDGNTVKASGKKAYEAPKLSEYGDLSKLTQGAVTVGADVSTAGPHGKNTQCL